MKIIRKISIMLMAICSVFVIKTAQAGTGIGVARAFYQLAHQNNPQKIESLLNRGYSLESKDERGYNSVCLSVIRQDRIAYKTLISLGAEKSPDCLKKIPESAYKRFFGRYPTKEIASLSQSDTPYLVGTGVVAVGAITAGYLLRGNTSGGSSKDDGGDDPDNPSKPDEPTHDDCINGQYIKGECICNDGYIRYYELDVQGKKSKAICTPVIPNCINQEAYHCRECKAGYYAWEDKCVQNLPHCVRQTTPDICLECEAGTIEGRDGKCYSPIAHCESQNGGVCERCETGYGTHNGDGSVCYKDIERCQIQDRSSCVKCVLGYGTHGDSNACYKDIEFCIDQVQTACRQCDDDHSTFGDPAADICYDANPCTEPNMVPINHGETCVCDENRGYVDVDGVCLQTADGDYKEGEGNRDEWNDLNDQYCHAHGRYDITSKKCICYQGYTGNDCSSCQEDYLPFNGVCFQNIHCDASQNLVQVNNRCECKEGYTQYEGKCIGQITCELHHEQQGDTCVCKDNFDKATCSECEEGFTYDAMSDSCIRTYYTCEEKWTGEDCNICPAQFEKTVDGNGIEHCGDKCAANRAPSSEDDTDCTGCATGYVWSGLDNTCIKNECSAEPPVPGYVFDENNNCVCDEANGYARTVVGLCEQKQPDLIGTKNSNINNTVITVENDGVLRDVYGMKPVIEDDEGNETYYDNVYNALSSSGDRTASINITNQNSGNNLVYGIYAPSVIYNAAVQNRSQENTSATGTINIADSYSNAQIWGIYGEASDNIYNAFVFANGNGTDKERIENSATASILINKAPTSTGNVVGIEGNGYIYNAYAFTNDGVGTNVYAGSHISLINEGEGDVIGIYGRNSSAKINNAFSFLNSAVSDVGTSGNITVEGNENVYGIMGNSTIVNSETQFVKSYNKIGEFNSEGTISAKTHSQTDVAYGIYQQGGSDVKAEIFNAMGYNTKGTIIAENDEGGSAYGIFSLADLYTEEGTDARVYNNIYNAFRSSAKYGGEGSTAQGNIEVNIKGNSNFSQNATGIYAGGSVFNTYTNSGSDIMLDALGQITINDRSTTSDIAIHGIEGGGATIANAYSTGENKNIKTQTVGNILINISGSKSGESGEAVGIYTNNPTSVNAEIYNAALVNDQSNVEGNINISSSAGARAIGRMYGVYASRYNTNGGDPNEGQPKVFYNAYYNNENNISAGSVKGKIAIKTQTAAPDRGEYYGVYMNDGTAYNAYSTNPKADVLGLIDVDIAGARNLSWAVGMYGNNATLNNSGNSIIKVKNSGYDGTNVAYGMKGDSTNIYNNAEINVQSIYSNAYGIYANQGNVINDTNGVINVQGRKESYGIYALSGDSMSGSVNVLNKGTIFVTGGNNVGIYASGPYATVENIGTISLGNGDSCKGADCNNGASMDWSMNKYIVLANNATFANSGTLSSAESLDFDAMGGNVVLRKGGKFEAKENISGNLQLDANNVTNTFSKTTILEDALSAKDVNDVQLSSKSYMYNAELTDDNNDGQHDIVMNMKEFKEVFNTDVADYYETNYNHQKNMELFNLLKSAETEQKSEQIDADLRGTSTLPNMVEENLKVQRHLDRKMLSELFKEGDDIRRMVGGDAMYIGRDDYGTLTGYDITSESMYALYDKKLNNKYRAGLGMSITHANTDYNNDSTRKNFMIQGYVPLTYTNGQGLTAVSMARLGYSDGEYKRRANDRTYEADTQEITYGLLNELRYKIDLGYMNLTPFVGLNAIGWYQDSLDEGNRALALNIDSSNIFSLESALGLYLDKEVEFNQDSKLNTVLGIGYYHEFADPYRGINAHNNDMLYSYKLRDIENIHSRNRGILTAKVNYDYKDFSIYGELLQYLEKEYPLNIDVGIKYRF